MTRARVTGVDVELIGGKIAHDDEDWAVVVDDEGRRFAFQLSVALRFSESQ